MLKQEVKDAKQLQKFKDPEYLKLELSLEEKKRKMASLEKKLADSNRLVIML